MDPVFKDTMKRSWKISSPDRLTVMFHPSLLLTLGDLLAFYRAMFPQAATEAATAAAATDADAALGAQQARSSDGR
eukprot:363083-Chlamydomonas_euryale.AAC.1